MTSVQLKAHINYMSNDKCKSLCVCFIRKASGFVFKTCCRAASDSSVSAVGDPAWAGGWTG